MNEPIKWRPHEKQEEFIQIPHSVFEALYGGAAGGGKMISLETSIPTPDGIKLFGDIHPSDTIFDCNGNPTIVLAESSIEERELCYKLIFDDGSEIVAGSNHNWLTFNVKEREALHRLSDEFRAKRRESRPLRSTGKRPDLSRRNSVRVHECKNPSGSIKTTQEIYDTLTVRNSRVNHSIPTCGKWNFPEKNLSIDPYVLGVWLGDGSHKSGQYTGLDDEIKFNLNLCGYEVYDHSNPVSHWISGFNYRIKELGVFGNKHIPHDYLFASKEQRLALLQGLMDTDGSCMVDGQCEFSQKKKQIADGVHLLAISLGIKTHRGYKTVNGQTYYTVSWTSNVPVFRLFRKLERLSKEVRSTQLFRYIIGCEPVKSVPTKCIQIDNPNGLFIIDNGIVTHNSELLFMLPLVHGWFQVRGFKGLLMRRTYPELEKSLILKSRDYYPATGAEYKMALKRWEWKSGAIVDFGYAEYENDVRKYDTTEYNYIGFDELTSFTEFQYLYLTSRCRTSNSSLPAIIRSASNPGNIGHGWVRKRFVEPCKEGRVLIIDKTTKQKRIFIPARLIDNPYLMKGDPNYELRLSILPEAERRAKKDGDWWTFSGQVFDEWRSQRYFGEPENALHVIEPFEIPEWWPRILAVDWGYTAMTWAGWAAISPDDRLYLYREYACRKTKISIWAADIARLSQYEKLRDVVLDPSAWANRGDEKTIAQQFEEVSGLRPRKADNDRVGGKILMQEFLRWEKRPPRKLISGEYDIDIAGRILRNYGLDAYKEYLASFQLEKEETNLPKLQVFNHCREFIKAIPLCIYSEINPEDVAEFDGDDPYDGGRYLIKACHHFVKESKKGFEEFQKVDKVVSIINNPDVVMTPQLMTSFYRKMESLEKSKVKNQGISRFHGLLN